MTDDSNAPADRERQGGEPLGDAEAREKESGIDLSAGDNADATTDGGPDPVPGVEPDLRDAAAGPRQADVRSADRADR